MNNIDKIKVINLNNLKKFKIISKNKILESKINSWLDNGLILLPNIIDSIYELEKNITFMDPNIANLSFFCLDKNGEKIFVKLNNKNYYPNEERSIIFIKNNTQVEYFCINEIEHVYLVPKQSIKKETKNKVKKLNK